MGSRFKGKVVVVTGSGRGIGRAEALAFAAEGAKVVVNDLGGARAGTGRDPGPADGVVAEIKQMGGEAVATYDDVSTVEGGNNVIMAAINNFGKIDILVNNAGYSKDMMIFNMPPEEWDRVIKAGLYSVYCCTKPASVFMKQQRSGRIINTSSRAGLLGSTGQANYGAAKEGVVGFTRKVAYDLGPFGVTCNAVRPASGHGIQPQWREAWLKTGREAQLRAMESAKPEDIAPLVLWLASDEAANVNGHTFDVRSGKIALYSEPEEQKVIFTGGAWSFDELLEIMPKTLAAGLVNPVPPKKE